MGLNANFGDFGGNAGGSVATLFGAGDRAGNGPRNQAPAKFWLNVGYVHEFTDEETGETQTTFVSIAGLGGQLGRSTIGGIPLDSMEDFPLTGGTNMRKLRNRQNKLKAQLIAAAEKLEPGEERIISQDENTGFALQLRRVQEASDASDFDDDEDTSPIRLAV